MSETVNPFNSLHDDALDVIISHVDQVYYHTYCNRTYLSSPGRRNYYWLQGVCRRFRRSVLRFYRLNHRRLLSDAICERVPDILFYVLHAGDGIYENLVDASLEEQRRSRYNIRHAQSDTARRRDEEGAIENAFLACGAMSLLVHLDYRFTCPHVLYMLTVRACKAENLLLIRHLHKTSALPPNLILTEALRTRVLSIAACALPLCDDVGPAAMVAISSPPYQQELLPLLMERPVKSLLMELAHRLIEVMPEVSPPALERMQHALKTLLSRYAFTRKQCRSLERHASVTGSPVCANVDLRPLVYILAERKHTREIARWIYKQISVAFPQFETPAEKPQSRKIKRLTRTVV
jgi:hypothetical protein